MAEGYLAKRLKEEGLNNITAASSGTAAFPGLGPSGETIQVMKEEGVDVSGYRSSTLERKQIEEADAILVMTPAHKERVLGIDPSAATKTYLLRKFSIAKLNIRDTIDDPIGKPVDFYRKVLNVIKSSIEGFLIWIKK